LRIGRDEFTLQTIQLRTSIDRKTTKPGYPDRIIAHRFLGAFVFDFVSLQLSVEDMSDETFASCDASSGEHPVKQFPFGSTQRLPMHDFAVSGGLLDEGNQAATVGRKLRRNVLMDLHRFINLDPAPGKVGSWSN
jgi:hypothetical protein